jgi:hypothetical protein
MVHVHTPGVHRRYAHVNTQIEFEPINQEGVRDVAANYTVLINWYFAYIVYDVNSFTLTRILRFDDPFIRLLLTAETVEMRVKIGKLIW